MPLLILAIALFLGFFVVVALRWITSTLESREIHRKRIHTLTKPLPLFSITDAFDPICSLLWEAPIAALELIDSAGESGIPVVRLHPIFNKAVTCFPEIYEGCSFVQWLQFLERTQLISWHGYRVVLTLQGRGFLKYRFTTEALVAA